MAALERLTTRINIEMTGDTKRYLVSAKQGDKATRYIIAKLLNDGTAYTIPTGARVAFNVEKPDGKHVYNTQLITTASFTIEIEKSMRNDNAILSANEFTELEDRIAGHIKNINDTEAAVRRAEAARVTAENGRVTAENGRVDAENIRNQNENTRIQQENLRQQNTAQAVKNAQDATAAAGKATKECLEVTKRAEDALQNQEQLEATLNTAVQIRQDVSQMQSAVTAAKEQVERDKEEIEDTIQNSLLASAEQILDSVKSYFERAESLYQSMYFECDGETPFLRVVSPIFIDGATPAVRNMDIGVDFDGGTPTSRLLAV